jgi:hypothetical protein
MLEFQALLPISAFPGLALPKMGSRVARYGVSGYSSCRRELRITVFKGDRALLVQER